MPNCLAGFHGRRLRRKNAHKVNDRTVHKQLSVITPRHIRNFARAERLSVELLTGAFCCAPPGARLRIIPGGYVQTSHGALYYPRLLARFIVRSERQGGLLVRLSQSEQVNWCWSFLDDSSRLQAHTATLRLSWQVPVLYQ